MKTDFNKNILARYVDNTCSDQERALIEQWFEQYSNNPPVQDRDLNRLVRSLDGRMGLAPKKTKIFRWDIAASVAAALLIFGFVVLYFIGDQARQTKTTLIPDTEIRAPMASNAFIVLDNNSEFDLDDLPVGDTLSTSTSLITKLSDGSIIYLPLTGTKDQMTVYNTLITKARGTASLTLSDGSKVWINANSKLTYPITFDSKTREVELQGEGYFEIEKQLLGRENIPFYVRGKDRTIKVLGTRFNIDFYDQRSEIALLEGKITVAGQGSTLEDSRPLDFEVNMSPNQVLKTDKLIFDPHIDRYVDWKDGYFNLDGVTLHQLGRKLEDWYGVSIHIDKTVRQAEMFGRVSRTKSLNEVLDLISEAAPVSYSIAEDKVRITKKDNI